jgi:hypothetical protein
VKLSALNAGRTLPPERVLILISVRGSVDTRAIVWLEIPVMSSKIEPENLRLVAQLRDRVPLSPIESY